MNLTRTTLDVVVELAAEVSEPLSFTFTEDADAEEAADMTANPSWVTPSVPKSPAENNP